MNHQSSSPNQSDLTYAELRSPAIITTPGPGYRAITRKFQGIPSIARGPDDRLWAVWYGGITPGEDHNNYVILAVSADHGRTWSDEQLIIDPDGEGPVRAYDPEIWLAPDGRLWLFWAQNTSDWRTTGSPCGVWAITTDNPCAAAPNWSAPTRLCDGVMMCKPMIRSNHEWCLPVSLWHQREQGSAAMWVSNDQGKTWRQRGACDVPAAIRSYDEHMIIERRDGSLWMLVRTLQGIGESISTDDGKTWSTLQPSGIPHPSSRFFIRRLISGRLLMVRHDPQDDNIANGTSHASRSHLTAFLSEDDGQTWPHSLLLDERLAVSYPDGDQAPDGTLFIIYDYQRTTAREILLAVLQEEDILKGHPSKTTRLRETVNKAGGKEKVES